MRNKIVTIIILVSVALLAFAIFNGISIGNFQILSISQIIGKNNDLNVKIEEATNLASIEFPKSVETLNNSFEQYTIKKEKYEELSGISSKETIDLYETKQYDISYLWRILGNYAKDRYLTLQMEVQKASGVNNLYSFNFKVSGEYVNIIQFITDLENNSDLYFRIYDFKMNGNGTTITSSFKVENVNVDPSTIKGGETSNTTNLFGTN